MVLPTGSGVGKIEYRFDLRDEYVEFIKKCVPVDLTGKKIVIDCAEGASYYTSVKALTTLARNWLRSTQNRTVQISMQIAARRIWMS